MGVTAPDRDRFRGCLLGLAVGDAVGTAVEFAKPGTFAPLTDMNGGGPFSLEPGQWTDDTSMALCLATSLVELGRFDVHDQMERYVRWRDDGELSSNGRCFDIGFTVSAALDRFVRTGDPLAGSDDPETAGNGSLMRLAPVPMAHALDPALAIARSGESSRTTHAAPAAVDACRWFAGLLVRALRGDSREELLAGDADFDPPLDPLIAAIAQGSFLAKEPPAIRGTGYVVASLEAAMWAFARAPDFRSGCLAAANLGDDADTTAAIYGQIAGAHFGASGIPAEWLARLAMRGEIEALADGLRELAEGRALS